MSVLTPLYNFVRQFLYSLQKEEVGPIVERYNITTWSEFLLNSGTKNTGNFTGFFVCITVGIMFIVIIPLLGCGYACSPTFCCCGDHKDTCLHKKLVGKSSCLNACAFTLLGLAFLVLGFAVINIAVISLFQKQLVDGKLNRQVGGALLSMDRFLQESNQVMIQQVCNYSHASNEDTIAALSALPQFAEAAVLKETDAGPAFASLGSFAHNLTHLNGNLSNIDSLQASLHKSSVQLAEELTDIQSKMTDILPGCGVPCEGAVTTQMGQLNISTDYTEIMPMAPFIYDIQRVIASGFEARVSFSESSVHLLSAAVNASVYKDVGLGKLKVEKMGMEVENFCAEVSALASDDTLKTTGDLFLANNKPVVGSFTTMRLFLAVVYICTILLLLLVALILLGVYKGVFSKPRGDDKWGIRLTSASICLIFSFAWFLMVLTTLFFVAGGFVEVNMCRHWRAGDDSGDKAFQLSKNELGLKYDWLLSDLLPSCEKNITLYKADYATNVGDLSPLLSNVPDILTLSPLQLSPVRFTSSAVDTTMDFLHPKRSEVGKILSVYSATSKPIADTDIGAYAELLQGAAEKVSEPGPKKAVGDMATRLRELSEGLVSRMENDRAELNKSAHFALLHSDYDYKSMQENLTLAQQRIGTIPELQSEKFVLPTTPSVEAFVLPTKPSVGAGFLRPTPTTLPTVQPSNALPIPTQRTLPKEIWALITLGSSKRDLFEPVVRLPNDSSQETKDTLRRAPIQPVVAQKPSARMARQDEPSVAATGSSGQAALTELVVKVLETEAVQVNTDFSDIYKTVLFRLENEIGHCRPLYDAVTLLIDEFCEETLQPFNAIWFTYALILAHVVVILFFAIPLVGYMKIKNYAAKKRDRNPKGKTDSESTLA